MDNWIEHVSEPDRLILAWQAPDNKKDRQRWAVGELSRRGDGVRLRYFRSSEFEKLNFNQPFSLIENLGYRGYPAFPIDVDEHSQHVLEAFMRRLPPRSRPDFERYRQHLRLQPQTQISDFALLGLSEAQLPSDGFSIVDPLRADVQQLELVSELAGYRYHIDKHRPLVVGDPIELVSEPGNPHDGNAVMATLHGGKVGYINRLQAPTMLTWIGEERIAASVERLNGSLERPRAFIFVKVKPIS